MLWKLAALVSLLIAPAGPSVIEMTSNMVFLPKELAVVAGEVVVWKNVSQMSHSVNTIADQCKTGPSGSTPGRSNPTRSSGSASTCRAPISISARSTKTR